jgi:hypothetical protein
MKPVNSCNDIFDKVIAQHPFSRKLEYLGRRDTVEIRIQCTITSISFKYECPIITRFFAVGVYPSHYFWTCCQLSSDTRIWHRSLNLRSQILTITTSLFILYKWFHIDFAWRQCVRSPLYCQTNLRINFPVPSL